MARHPWGKIPVLTMANGFTIHESRAISKYLARKYSIPLVPAVTDIEASALFDQADCVELAYFAEPAGKIGYEKFVKKFRGLPVDENVVSQAVEALETYFDIAERTLKGQKFMAGDDFSLVDIHYIPLVQRLFVCGYGDLVTTRSNVNDWWTRCLSRPAIQQLMLADREAMAAARK